jgi:hypothetical protein
MLLLLAANYLDTSFSITAFEQSQNQSTNGDHQKYWQQCFLQIL